MSHLALDGEQQRAQRGLPEQTQGALSRGGVAAPPLSTTISEGPLYWGEDGLGISGFRSPLQKRGHRTRLSFCRWEY